VPADGKDPNDYGARELKQWLVRMKPALSTTALAEELNVDRKTLGSILNPDSKSFGHGSTLIRYLQHVEALKDPPVRNPADSPLARLEAKIESAAEATEEALARLSGAIARIETRLDDADDQRQKEDGP